MASLSTMWITFVSFIVFAGILAVILIGFVFIVDKIERVDISRRIRLERVSEDITTETKLLDFTKGGILLTNDTTSLCRVTIRSATGECIYKNAVSSVALVTRGEIKRSLGSGTFVLCEFSVLFEDGEETHSSIQIKC